MGRYGMTTVSKAIPVPLTGTLLGVPVVRGTFGTYQVVRVPSGTEQSGTAVSRCFFKHFWHEAKWYTAFGYALCNGFAGKTYESCTTSLPPQSGTPLSWQSRASLLGQYPRRRLCRRANFYQHRFCLRIAFLYGSLALARVCITGAMRREMPMFALLLL